MSGEPQPRARLARTVILLGWVSFFADVSGEMTYPLLPLFVVGALGASATSLGWIEGVAQAGVAVLAAWAGWRSDRVRRRTPYIRFGYGLPVLGKVIWLQLLLLIVILPLRQPGHSTFSHATTDATSGSWLINNSADDRT